MCGICGKVDLRGKIVEKELLYRMCSVMKHRGPDDEGIFCDKNVGLGHRRLSIIDLAGGHQPMSDESEQFGVVFNGEIYNFHEIRTKLMKKGYHFRTNSDTEVIIQAYAEYGENCVRYFNGMFAFAIYDRVKRKLFLARDRLGIKPLYYYYKDGMFIFASEMKAILEDPLVARELDWQAFNYYLSYNYIPAPHSIIRDVKKLLQGCYLILDVKTGRLETKKYWEIPTYTDDNLKEEEIKEKLIQLISDSVKRRLISDVPLGAFLSGGIDSSTIVGMMTKTANAPVETFSIGFKEKDYDESNYAQQVANHLGTNHHLLVIEPKADINLLKKLVWQFDEPFADSTLLANYLLAKLTREYVTVALSGDGGDELFGGYRKFVDAQKRLPFARFPKFLRHGLIHFGIFLPLELRGRHSLTLLGLEFPESYIARLNRFTNYSYHITSKQHFLTRDALHQIGVIQSSNVFLEQLFSETGDLDFINKLLYVDLKSYLVENNLTKVDKTSMLTSLEVRVPFLDYTVVEFAMTIPERFKIHPNGNKYILREIVRHILPKNIVERPKQGFNLPLGQWFRTDWYQLARDILLGKKAMQRGIFNVNHLRYIIERHKTGKWDYYYPIFMALVFELWCQTYLDQT